MNRYRYIGRYIYGVKNYRYSGEFFYADGTARGAVNANGEYGENPASDFAVNDMRKVLYKNNMVGSSLYVADMANCETTCHMIYDPWGNPQIETYMDMNLEGMEGINNYTGYTYDEVLDLYFAQNRFYDPVDRRFIQEDNAKDGDNWYAYCENNPLTNVDPLGNAKRSWWDFIEKYNISVKNGANRDKIPMAVPQIFQTGYNLYRVQDILAQLGVAFSQKNSYGMFIQYEQDKTSPSRGQPYKKVQFLTYYFKLFCQNGTVQYHYGSGNNEVKVTIKNAAVQKAGNSYLTREQFCNYMGMKYDRGFYTYRVENNKIKQVAVNTAMAGISMISNVVAIGVAALDIAEPLLKKERGAGLYVEFTEYCQIKYKDKNAGTAKKPRYYYELMSWYTCFNNLDDSNDIWRAWGNPFANEYRLNGTKQTLPIL